VIEKSDKKRKDPARGTLGEALDEVGFKPLGRRIKVEKVRVVNSLSGPKWFAPVVTFLTDVLPGTRGDWQHLHIGAYEAACELLVRLGYAVETVDGAKSVSEVKKMPEILPRWDDIATTVVCVASQSGLLEYHHFSNSRGGARPRDLSRANIRAAHGSGPAHLASHAIPVFQALGMIRDECWTGAAETILWRDLPEQWPIDFTRDDRFLHARDVAIATLPRHIADEINKVTTIQERDIVEWLELAKRHAKTPKTRQDALRSLRFWCVFGLDGIFHRRWRLDDGWLDAREEARAIYIAHDPLALNMRAAFAALYLPELPFLAR
jgi:hypothetical protein